MKFTGTFHSNSYGGLYSTIFGNPVRGNAFVEINSDGIMCTLTYLGTYLYGQSKNIKLVLNKNLSVDDKCVYDSTNLVGKNIQITFSVEGSNIENIEVNKPSSGTYTSSSPCDSGTMTFKRIE